MLTSGSGINNSISDIKNSDKNIGKFRTLFRFNKFCNAFNYRFFNVFRWLSFW